MKKQVTNHCYNCYPNNKRLPIALLLMLCLFLGQTTNLQAENPPYAQVINGPFLNGANVEFIVQLPTNVSNTDCPVFTSNCNNDGTGAGIDNVDIYWSVRASSNCAGCDLNDAVVLSGIVNHGFWGTNCDPNQTDVAGSSCGDPGGCNNTISFPFGSLCPGVNYELVTYAFNPDYDKGLADGSSSAPGPYECCFGLPPVGGIMGMESCGAWLNPSRPQSSLFNLGGTIPAPTVTANLGIQDGETITCGYDWSLDIQASPTGSCGETILSYTISLNGQEIDSDESNCSDATQMFIYAADLIACLNDADCSAETGQIKGVCGQNTLSIEVTELCGNANVYTESISFTIECPDAGVLETASPDELILCPNEVANIQLNAPPVIPYASGTYELHYNNSNPYNDPTTNYLGSGTTATLANDGTFDTSNGSVELTIIGTIWENFDTQVPDCLVFSETVTVVMLSPISLSNNPDVCSDEINVMATGGLPDYNGGNYIFDLSEAGGPSNSNTGFLDGVAPGTYNITVSDGEGCTANIMVTVDATTQLSEVPFTYPDDCDTANNTFSLQLTGDLSNATNYDIISDIDGTLGNPDATGLFIAANNLTAGIHQISANLSGADCLPEAITIEVYNPLSISLSTDACALVNQVAIGATSGGRDPNHTQGGGFANVGDYTIFLSQNDLPNAANDVPNAQGTLTDVGTFTGVAPGSYFLILEDDRGCQTSLPITVMGYDNLMLDITTADCVANTIDLSLNNTDIGWNFYLYALGVAFDNGTSQIDFVQGTQNGGAAATIGTFNNANAGQYTIYAQDADACTLVSTTVDVFDELQVSQEISCNNQQVQVVAMGGYAGASFTTADYTFTLLDNGGTPITSNNTGTFTNQTAGEYTVEVTDNNPNVTGGCIQSITVEFYADWDIVASSDLCTAGGNTILVTDLLGGQDPAIFTNGAYTVVVSTSPTSLMPANDTQGNPLMATIPPDNLPLTFDNLPLQQDFYIVLTDGRTDPTNNSPCLYAEGPFSFDEALSITANAPSCEQNNQISVVTTDGTAPFDYYIYPQTNPNLQGAPNPPTTAYDPTAAANGAALDTGGTPLAFTGEGNNFTANNVPAGLYTVHVVDASGCQFASVGMVEVFDPLNVDTDTNPCAGLNELTVTTASGGDPAYSIFLSTTAAPNATPDVSTTPSTLTTIGTFTNVAEGSYHLVITDSRGCQFSRPVSVAGAATLLDITPDCTYNTLQITTNDGTPNWDFYLLPEGVTFDPANPNANAIATDLGTGSSDNTATFTGIAEGMYVVYGIDAGGCIGESPVLSVYKPLSINAISRNCGFGIIEVTDVQGGTDPNIFSNGGYTIFLSTDGISNNVNPLLTLNNEGSFPGGLPVGGVYYVVVEDKNGCRANVGPLTVEDPFVLEQVNVSCVAGNISVQATGGTPDITFYLYTSNGTYDAGDPENPNNGWLDTDDPDGTGTDNSAIFTNTTADNFIVYAIDANNCIHSGLPVVSSLAPVLTDVTATCSYAAINTTASGGTGLLTYTLTDSQGNVLDTNTSGDFTIPNTGTYTVAVKDEQNCSDSLVITKPYNPLGLQTPYDCAELMATGGAGSTYLYQIFTPNLQTLVDQNQTGLFPNLAGGDYIVRITDSLNCQFQQLIMCEGCDLTAVVDTIICLNDSTYGVQLAFSGSNTYNITSSAGDNLVGQTTGTITLGPFDNGNYTITVQDEMVATCNETFSDVFNCLPCDLPTAILTACNADSLSYNATVELDTTTTFTIQYGNTTLTNQSGTVVIDTILFANNPREDYTFVITDENNADCSISIDGSIDCTTCKLPNIVTTSCTGLPYYSATIELPSTDTYTIAYDTITLTGQTGQLLIDSLLLDGMGQATYQFTITSEIDADCNITLTGQVDCLDCVLPDAVVTACLPDLTSYSATFELGDEAVVGTFTIQFENTTLINQSGTVVLQPLSAPLGNTAYSFTITSDLDPDCTTTLMDTINCLECTLPDAVVVNCNADSTAYSASIDLGNIGTYSVSYGNTFLSGQSGILTIDNLPLDTNNMANFSFNITSELDSTCNTTLTGTIDCFVCELPNTIVVDCHEEGTFQISVDLGTEDTYTIISAAGTTPGVSGLIQSDSLPIPLGGVVPYDFTIISETDTTCQQQYTGSVTCFACDLALSAETVCNEDNQSFNVNLSIQGSGLFDLQTPFGVVEDIGAGALTLSNYPLGNYTLTLISQTDTTCVATVTIDETCFDCELPTEVVATCSTDQQFYTASIELDNNSTYTIQFAGQTFANQSGTFVLDSIGLTGGSADYSFIITDEQDATCTTTLTGTIDCFQCILPSSVTATCNEDANGYDVVIDLGDSDTYQIQFDGNLLINQSGTVTLENLPLTDSSINYSFTIVSETDNTCSTTLTGSLDCFACVLPSSLAASCTDENGYDVVINLGNSDTYQIQFEGNLLINQSGTVTLENLPLTNGSINYSFTIVSETDNTCSTTLTGSLNCACNLPDEVSIECTNNNSLSAAINLSATETYSIDIGLGAPIVNLSGNVTLPLSIGDYTIIVTSEANPTCSVTFSGTENCFDCMLPDGIATTCNDDNETYTATVNLGSADTYTVTFGSNVLSNQSGTISLLLPNGANIVTITSESDSTCTQNYELEENCFDCVLEVAVVDTNCINIDNFSVVLSLQGEGDYTVNSANGPILSNQEAGQFIYGPLASGQVHNINITSNLDPTCNTNLLVNINCFDCDLSASATPVCNDDFETYNVNLTVSGTGTFAIDDGINPVLTGQSAGNYTLSNLPIGINNIQIVSEIDNTCTLAVVVEEDCFDCTLTTSNVATECQNEQEYSVSFNLLGQGSYTILASNGTVLNNQTSGTISIDGFPNGDYNINIISEIDSNCETTIAGENQCIECDLPNFATTNCLDDNSYEVIITLTGNGTYNILDENNNVILANVTAGNISVGPFDNGDYAVEIVQNEVADCTVILSGSNDCTPDIPCDPAISASVECVDEDSYNVLLNFSASNSYTIDDGINPPLSNQSSGLITVGPIPNGAYNIVVTNESDPDCRQTISGSRDCTVPIECDLALDVTTACLADTLFSLVLNIQGTGSYALDDGQGNVEPNVTAGNYEFLLPLDDDGIGSYNFTVTDENAEDCSLSVSGVQDCSVPFTCDAVILSATPACLTDDVTVYDVLLDFSGSGTYTIDDGVNPVLTGQLAGEFALEGLPNGEYNIAIISEEDPTCVLNVAGTFSCESPIICDPAVVTSTECIDFFEYEVTLELTGTGSYTIFDGINAPLTNQTAGTIVVGPIPNGDFVIDIVNEADTSCVLTTTGNAGCNFDCELTVNSTVNCLANGQFELTLFIEGNSTYTILDGVNNPITGVPANDSITLTLPDGDYTVTVTNEANSFCSQVVSGSKFCSDPNFCDLEISTEWDCSDLDSPVLTLTIEGTGTFNVLYDFEGGLFDIPAGVYVIEYESSFFYDVFVERVEEPFSNCTAYESYGSDCDEQCDLEVETEIVCIPNATDSLYVTISGTGTYTIELYTLDFLNFQIIEFATAGVYAFAIPDGFYYLDVYGENFECFFATDNFNICPDDVDCDLSVSIQTECLGTDSLEITITLSGSSLYDIYINLFAFQTSPTNPEFAAVPAGTYTIIVEDFFDYFSEYYIFVEDTANRSCNAQANGFQICNPDCDMQVTYETECLSNGRYNVLVTVEGSNNYSLSDYFDTFYMNVPAGTYTFGPYDDAFFFNIEIVDNENSGCFQNISIETDCPFLGSCDLSATLDFECQPEAEQYNAIITITGSDTYTIQGSEGEPITGVGAGTYIIPDLTNGTYSIGVVNDNDSSCQQTFEGTNFCVPPPPCDLVATPNIVCADDNSTYTISLTISGSSQYNVFRDGNTPVAENVSGGETIEIDIPSGEPYIFNVVDDENDLCNQNVSGTFTCGVVQPCDLDASAVPICDGEEYFIDLTISGSATYFVDDGQGNFLDNVGSGNYRLGPYNEPNYEVSIFSNGDEFCFRTLFGSIDCTGQPPLMPPCDVTANLVMECIDLENYVVNLEISGSSTYSIYEGLYVGYPDFTELLIANVPAGNYQTPPLPNGGYSILVLDDNNDECYVDFIGYRDCTAPTSCDVNAGVTMTCIDEESYNMSIDLEGSSTYNIIVFDELGGDEVIELFGVTAADSPIEAGPLFGLEYYIFIQDENNDLCNQDFLGIRDCTPPGGGGGGVEDCDLNVSFQANCVPDNEDALEITLTITEGNSTYSFFSDNPFGPTTEYASGLVLNETITIMVENPFSGGPFEVPAIFNGMVEDENNSDCLVNISQIVNCPDPDPACDFTVSIVENCNENGTYDVFIGIDGEGGAVYDVYVTDGLPGGPGPGGFPDILFEAQDQSPGVVTVSGLNEDTYAVIVGVEVDLGGFNPDLECVQNFERDFECPNAPEPPSCDLQIAFDANCVPDDDSALEVTMTIAAGSSTYTFASDNPFGPNETYASGMTVGESVTATIAIDLGGIPIPGELPASFIAIVEDEVNPDCYINIAEVINCPDPSPACDFTVSVAENCNENNSYDIFVGIDGDDAPVYDIIVVDGIFNFDAFPNILFQLNDQSTGLVTIPALDSDVFTVIVGVDIDLLNLNLECAKIFEKEFNCDDPTVPTEPCTLQLTSTSVECIAPFEFNIAFTIKGNSTYTVESDVLGTLLTGLPAGDYDLGPFGFDFSQITVFDESDVNCRSGFTAFQDCVGPPSCDLTVTPTIECTNDEKFLLVVEITGSDTYNVNTTFGNESNLSAGTHTFGPAAVNTYQITVQSLQNPDCFFSTSGTEACNTEPPTPTCNLSVTSSPDCVSDSSFVLVLNISGSDTYTINDGVNLPLTNQSAGEISVGPLPSGLPYNISITSEVNADCNRNLSGTQECAPPTPSCDLSAISQISCVDENGFELTLTILGSSTYTITGGEAEPVTGVTVGEISFTLPNGLYEITLTDENNADCFQSISGARDCSTPFSCDLDANITTVSCVDEENFEVRLTLSGSSVYTVDDGVNEPLVGQTAGFVNLLPLPNGSYTISITDEVNADCFQTVSGFRNCFEPPVCDLEAIISNNCLSENEYELVLTLTGTSTYTITDGIHPNLTGQTAGDINLGSFDNGNYAIQITSEADPTCSTSIVGAQDCTFVPICELEADILRTTCVDENNFGLTIQLTGTGTYRIEDGIHPALTGQSAGEIDLPALANGSYNINIISETIDQCSQTLAGVYSCDPNAPTCDLSASANAIDGNQGAYYVSIELAGESSYTVSDDMGNVFEGVIAGNTLLGPLPVSMCDYNININDENNATCNLQLTGQYECFSNFGAINSLVFNDLNQNGVQDDGEPGLVGITVVVYDANNGNEVATLTTDEDGYYTFDNLLPGSYYIVVVIPENFVTSPQNAGSNDNIDSDVDNNGRSITFDIEAGDNVGNVDAGLYELREECVGFMASVAGTCNSDVSGFYDLNIAIAGGTPPYFIDGGDLFTGTVSAEDLPLAPVPNIPSSIPYRVTITDANNCLAGIFTGTVPCLVVSVDLLDFTGEVLAAGNLLKWTTASETNNDYFTLLRSSNGIDFEPITNINGAGTKATPSAYEFLDKNAPSGLSYYRLGQTDFDGTQTASNIISLLRGETTFGITQIVPIPVQDYVQISFTATQQERVYLDIYDLLGRRLHTQPISAEVGINQLEVNMQQYAPGTYIITMRNAKKVVSEKVVKE